MNEQQAASVFRAKNQRRKELSGMPTADKLRLFSSLRSVGLRMRKTRPILGASNVQTKIFAAPAVFAATGEFEVVNSGRAATVV